MVAPRSTGAQGSGFGLESVAHTYLDTGKHGRKQSTGTDRRHRHGA